jgi:YVTN family beta-propeller protein
MVTVVDAQRHVATSKIAIPNDGVTGPLNARPMGLALSADNKTLYVANGRGGTISIVDTASLKVVRTVAGVGGRPWGLAVSADGATLYSANGPSNDVAVIDIASGKVTQKIATCGSPWGLALSAK